MEQSDMEMVELSLKQAKEKVAMAVALRRLRKNKDFQKVISGNFMKDDAIRVVTALAEPAYQNDESQRHLLKRLDAVGQLEQFMRATETLGDMAAKAIEDDERTRQEMLGEEV